MSLIELSWTAKTTIRDEVAPSCKLLVNTAYTEHTDTLLSLLKLFRQLHIGLHILLWLERWLKSFMQLEREGWRGGEMGYTPKTFTTTRAPVVLIICYNII